MNARKPQTSSQRSLGMRGLGSVLLELTRELLAQRRARLRAVLNLLQWACKRCSERAGLEVRPKLRKIWEELG